MVEDDAEGCGGMVVQSQNTSSEQKLVKHINPMLPQASPPSPSACFTSTLVHSLTSPSPVQSTQSTIFGRPQLVTCKPAAAGSTPVSKIATQTPRPSQEGRKRRKASACGGGWERGQWE